ncbi:hypothetical protein V8F33_010122 [Rhypophila sp. PSN 637]
MRFTLLVALSATGYCFCKRNSSTPTGWGNSSSTISESAGPGSATPTSWFAKSYVGGDVGTLRIIQYGSVAVTPVPTSTLPAVIEEITITEPTASSNIESTEWIVETTTIPVVTDTVVIPVTKGLPPHSKFVNSTTTKFDWVSPTIATLTFTKTPVAEACLAQEVTTVTEYTGTYSPLPDQDTEPRTRFPTALLTQDHNTITYRLFPYTGTTETTTITETYTAGLTTETITVTQSEQGGRYTSTHYASTVTATRSEFQLAYTTVTATPFPASGNSSCAATKTITQAHKCAPTNLLREQDGLGVAIRILPNEWSFPIGFSDTILGVPGGLNRSADAPDDGLTLRDASACCQLCVDNPGCAGSEWAIEDTYNGGCRLYWYNDPADGEGNFDGETIDPDTGAIVASHGKRDTCGKRVDGIGGVEEAVGLQYYANFYALAGQASYVQSGCGRLMFVGEMDPWF